MKEKNDAAKTATPFKPVNEGQIGKLNQNVTAKLLKHKDEIPSDVFQQMLGDKTLLNDIYSDVMRRVRVITNVITFHMGKVKPAGPTTVDDAVKNGHYTGHFGYLKNKKNAKIMENWPKDLPEVEIFFGLVPSGEVIPKSSVKEYWAQRGYEIPKHADAYLHQLMCNIPTKEIQKELQEKYLVAYTDTPNFRDRDGLMCRLYVDQNDSDRELVLVFELGGWHDDWVFLLCKKTSETDV